MITMEETVKQWVQHAEQDLETARALVASKRNLHALFFCQQSIEKALKAIIQLRTNEMPPRIHNLPRLAELAGVSVDSQGLLLLAEFSVFYIESRYSQEIEKLAASTTNAAAKKSLQQTEEMVAWLLSILN